RARRAEVQPRPPRRDGRYAESSPKVIPNARPPRSGACEVSARLGYVSGSRGAAWGHSPDGVEQSRGWAAGQARRGHEPARAGRSAEDQLSVRASSLVAADGWVGSPASLVGVVWVMGREWQPGPGAAS